MSLVGFSMVTQLNEMLPVAAQLDSAEVASGIGAAGQIHEFYARAIRGVSYVNDLEAVLVEISLDSAFAESEGGR